MNAIRGVDFQFRRALLRHHFVDRGGTEILAGIAVLANAAVAANIRIENDEMARLILFVARAGMIDVGEAIEGKLAIAFESRGLVNERCDRDSVFDILCTPVPRASDPPGRARR